MRQTQGNGAGARTDVENPFAGGGAADERRQKNGVDGGASLSPVVGGYSYRNPSQSLPRIISSGSSSASIEAIRSYFTDEQVIVIVKCLKKEKNNG